MNENVNVCITPKGDKPVLHFSQFDNENIFTVTVLADDGESAAVLTGLDIEFRIRKTDSHVVTIAPESVADNVITFKTTEQMCACCGQNIASVVLMKDDMIVSTLDILVDIQRDILSGGLTSESDIRNLTTQIEQIVPEVVGDDYYTKTEVDEKIAEIPTFDPSNYYDKNYINTMYWTAQQIDQLFYRKTYINDNYYTKDDVYTKSEVYNKTETDNLLSAKMDNIGYHGVVDDAAVISFTTDCNAPLDIIKGNITPVQDLHGYTKPWSGGGGKNILVPTAIDTTSNNVRVVGDSSGKVTVTGTASADTQIEIYSFVVASPDTYTLILKDNLSGSNNTYWVSMSGVGIITSGKRSTFAFASAGTFKLRINVKSGSATNFTIYPMVAKGNVDIPYEPYSNICPISGFSALNVTLADGDMQTVESKTVNFGQTVYGGVLDVTNGKLKITHDNIASYNGESINEPWLSSMEVYVPNTTPTTGAQVVYPLATPTEITTTPETVSSISGDNNIFIDTGNMTEIAYFENAEDNLIKLIKACQI